MKRPDIRRKMTSPQMKGIVISALIIFLLCPRYFTLDDDDFDTFIAKTIMEDPWLNVSITEEETVTSINAPTSTQHDVKTENYPSLDTEASIDDYRSKENHVIPSIESFQKYSIVILQSNCSDTKELFLNLKKIDAFNSSYLKDSVEDCRNFVSVKISDRISTQEVLTEIIKIFKNHVVIKFFEDVGKNENVSLVITSTFSDFSEVKSYYYIIGGIIITFLILIIINFAVCSRKNRKNQSMDLTEIPHLTLATENFKLSIPRPTISTVHQNKNDDSVFSEYYQRGNSGSKNYSPDFQAFENVE